MIVRYPTEYVIYDFETTSLDTSTAEVIEIGAKKVTALGTSIRSWLIDIGKPLSDETVRVTGITDGYLKKNGILPERAWAEFKEFAGRQLPLLGHNISRYDNLILARYWPERNLADSIDTAGLYKGIVMSDEQRWYEDHLSYVRRILETRRTGLKYNLVHACESMKIDVKDVTAHRAAADVEMCDRLYKKLCL